MEPLGVVLNFGTGVFYTNMPEEGRSQRVLNAFLCCLPSSIRIRETAGFLRANLWNESNPFRTAQD